MANDLTASQGAPEGETVLNPLDDAQPTGAGQNAAEQAEPQENTEGAEPKTEETGNEPAKADVRTVPLPVFERRIGEVTRQRREAERKAEELERQNNAYREILDAQQRGQPADPANPAAARPQPNFESAVRVEAERLARDAEGRQQANAFTEQCNAVADSGKKAFADFDQALGTLNAMGVMTQGFVETVMQLDAPERVLHALGNDPDAADRIARLPLARQAVELDRLARAPAASKPVSKAPPPVKPVGGQSRSEVDLDRMSDEEFYRHAAKTPRSNCILDVTKLLATGVKMRPVHEALENSLRNWKN